MMNGKVIKEGFTFDDLLPLITATVPSKVAFLFEVALVDQNMRAFCFSTSFKHGDFANAWI